MNKFYSWPIRVHLTILIALIAAPSISLIIYSGMAQRHEEIAGAKTELLRFVNDIAGQQQTMVAGVKQLGTTLSLLPAIRSRNAPAAATLLVDLLGQNPQYTNIIVGDRSGLVWASGVPLKEKLYVGDRRHYRAALRTGIFSSGEYATGRLTKKPVMIFGYPVKKASNEVIAVIGVTLNLEYTQKVFEKLNFPSGASFSLLDHQGIILVGNLNDPVSEKLVGKRDTVEEFFTKMTKGLDEGTYEAMGNDGNPRLVAYKRISLPHESEPYLYVRSSIPLTSATSNATAAMFKSLSVFVLLFLIGLFLAWFIGKRLIVNPVMVLKEASERLAVGADTVNVSHVVTGGELGELARTFDDMAGALVQRETALRESEQRWATTLASIGDAVIATDEAGNITFMNAVAEELTGWTLIDASQRPLQEVFRIINEQTRQEVENPAAKALREGTVVDLANHTVLVRKDGAEVPIDDSGAPIRDAGGKTLGVVLVFRDITDHKQAEAEEERLLAELAEERTRWQTTVENMLDPVTLCDAEGRATYMNPAYQQLTKRSIAGSLTIEDHPEYYQIYRPDGTLFPAEELPLQKAARTGENVRNVELIQRSATGREFAAIFSAAPLHNAEGKVTGAVAVGHDITELKRTEKALKNAHADLEERVKERTHELSEAYKTLQKEVNERKKMEEHLARGQKLEALGTLAGGIAHDFNNILAGIIGFTEMVYEDLIPESPEYRKLELVLKGAYRGRDLVKQILSFSRQTAQDRKPLALKQAVEEGLKLLRPMLPSTIEIISRSVTNDDTILADPAQIHQILMNLCTNAAHAMREQGGVLNISISDTSLSERGPAPIPDMKPGKYVVLKVSDTGSGMEPETLERIFDPFFTTKQQGEGTGLGLSVVHGIIESHGGYVTVESKPGEGTTFQTYLPKIKEQILSEGRTILTATGGKECILVVDDEDILVELNKQRLSKLGYEVVTTTSSTDALDIFRKEPDKFDLVITDYTMPSLTGMDLAAELLKIRATIPIILCTGNNETVSRESAKESGIKAFLIKPLSNRELALTVRRVLDAKVEGWPRGRS